MSKKRPREEDKISKQDPEYWLGRLFRSQYTYKGRRLAVRNWSVKIQHLGKRKTFALHSKSRAGAAGEACDLYRALLTFGWQKTARQENPELNSQREEATTNKLNADYWAQRLVEREYTMALGTHRNKELSVRIDHLGTGHYFPLGTADNRIAVDRALRIYRVILHEGWEAAKKRFSRELTIAFRWLEVPLAWTYTTIHTRVSGLRCPEDQPNGVGKNRFLVSVTDSDPGIRRALERCVNHTAEFRCAAVYSSGAEVVREARRHPFHLALISQNLADMSGAACLEEMKLAVPEAGGLLYSAYEDSEELFRATPGGAGTYLLKRTAPTQFLEPIARRLAAGPLPGKEMAPAAWIYFKESLAEMPVGGARRILANLTQREHEVLVLIGKGHPDKDIADRLGISIYTVHEHVRKIFDKLGAHNRTEAAVKLLQK